jgi:hypothetical protein
VPVGRSQPAAAPRDGDRHDVRYTDQERSTSNAQRSTFNGVTERGLVGGIWGQTRNLGGRTLDPVDLTKRGSGGRGGLGAQIWGQTRCPIYRLGTFNVKRSTLNFQWGERKGAWWSGYGDRHVIWATGLLTRRTCPSAGWVVQAGPGAQRWGQTRCPISRSGTFNVKRSTLNF